MIHLEPGSYLIRQGDVATCAYLIESGSVEVFATTNSGERSLAILGKGEIVGEMALVDRAPRTASVRAYDACTVMPITSESIDKRLVSADPVLRLVLGTILDRYRALLGTNGAGSAPQRSQALRSQAYCELRMEEDFAEAIADGQINVHYQPIIGLADHRLMGFEALARWMHPERGMISPAVFVPVAEASGASSALTRACLSQVMADLPMLQERAGRRGRHVGDLHVSVNVSGHDLMVPGFVRGLADLAAKAGIRHSALTLELTETVLVHNPGEAAAALQDARDAGFRIAIDDFGTGYSTLNYIRTLPIDILKIDKTFVQGMAECATTRSIVASTLSLAATLGIAVVAEGIELTEQHSILQMLECDYGQGFLFGRPLSVAQTLQLIDGWTASAAPHAICGPCA